MKKHLTWLIAISIIILLVCSSLKHALFESTAFDLGIFDQAVYLISQGQSPVSSFLGFHILGDHAALILYPLALLYKIYPHVSWLLAVQAISLSLGALPTWYLARHAGLGEKQATTMAIVYLLYPLVFNINLFDFHPEVIALPSILGAILAARLGNGWWFGLALILILSCKEILSLTVAAMGFWLLVFEKKRLFGAMALFAGIAWFIIATQVIVPSFGTGEPSGLNCYNFLGDSVLEVATNLLLKPGIVLSQIFTLPNLEYLFQLLWPVIWGLSSKHLTPLVPAIPALALNLISDCQSHKDLSYQYPIPILPFLLLAVITTFAAGKESVKTRKGIILWSLVAFLALAKFGRFASTSHYLATLDTWQGTKEAVALVKTKGSVLTSDKIAPHLTHRPVVKLATSGSESIDLSQFEYVWLNMRHPWTGTPDTVITLVQRLEEMPQFQLKYRRDDVVLYQQH